LWDAYSTTGSGHRRYRQVDELVASTVAEYGGVDILVANAGIVRAAEFLDMSEQDFDDVIRVNLKGTFLVRPSRATLTHPSPVRNRINPCTVVSAIRVPSSVAVFSGCAARRRARRWLARW